MPKPVVFIAEIIDIKPVGDERIEICLHLPSNFQTIAQRLLWLKRRGAILEISAQPYIPKARKDKPNDQTPPVP